MNVSYLTFWLLDFHTVWYPGSSGYFLLLNLLLFFFRLCKEAKCVYLCLHLGWKFMNKPFLRTQRMGGFLKTKVWGRCYYCYFLEAQGLGEVPDCQWARVLMRETWFFLLTYVKNYRSANLLACGQFISDLFPWKETGLGRVGGERQSFRAKQGSKSKSGWRPGWQAPGWPEAGCPEALWTESQECQEHPEPLRERERESFVLGEEKKSYILING